MAKQTGRRQYGRDQEYSARTLPPVDTISPSNVFWDREFSRGGFNSREVFEYVEMVEGANAMENEQETATFESTVEMPLPPVDDAPSG